MPRAPIQEKDCSYCDNCNAVVPPHVALCDECEKDKKPFDQLCNYCNAECTQDKDGTVYCTDSDCRGSKKIDLCDHCCRHICVCKKNAAWRKEQARERARDQFIAKNAHGFFAILLDLIDESDSPSDTIISMGNSVKDTDSMIDFLQEEYRKMTQA